MALGSRRRSRAALAGAVAAGLLAWAPAAPADEVDTCVWGGTPVDPTGQFSFEGQGLRLEPAAEAIPFVATGPATGEACKRTVTFEGVAEAGSSCAAVVFSGVVHGVRGVATFRGVAQAVNTHEVLYDRRGRAVGSNDPWTLNESLARQVVDPPQECTTPEGYTTGRFSSVITVFGA